MTYEEKVWDTFIRAYRGDLQAQAEILYVDAILNGDNRLIKEEKKMLNVEKYMNVIKEEIAENTCDSKSCLVAKVRNNNERPDCERRLCRDCEEESINWLFSEHQPLLRNGDGLKPGDWIMVKDPDNEVWVKKIFAYYYDGRFYCANDIAFFKNGLLVNRTKARLPEDGE